MADLTQRFNPMKSQTTVIKQLTNTLSQTTQTLQNTTQNLQTLSQKYRQHLTLYDTASTSASTNSESDSDLTPTFISPPTSISSQSQLMTLPFVQVNSLLIPQPPTCQTTSLHSANPALSALGLFSPLFPQQLRAKSLEQLSELFLTIHSVIPAVRELINEVLGALHNFYSNLHLPVIHQYPQFLTLVQSAINIDDTLRDFSTAFYTTLHFIQLLNDLFLHIDHLPNHAPLLKQLISSEQSNGTESESVLEIPTLPNSSVHLPNIDRELDVSQCNHEKFTELTTQLVQKLTLFENSVDSFTNLYSSINTDT